MEYKQKRRRTENDSIHKGIALAMVLLKWSLSENEEEFMSGDDCQERYAKYQREEAEYAEVCRQDRLNKINACYEAQPIYQNKRNKIKIRILEEKDALATQSENTITLQTIDSHMRNIIICIEDLFANYEKVTWCHKKTSVAIELNEEIHNFREAYAKESEKLLEFTTNQEVVSQYRKTDGLLLSDTIKDRKKNIAPLLESSRNLMYKYEKLITLTRNYYWVYADNNTYITDNIDTLNIIADCIVLFGKHIQDILQPPQKKIENHHIQDNTMNNVKSFFMFYFYYVFDYFSKINNK